MDKVKEIVNKVTHPKEHSSTADHTTGTHSTGTHSTGAHTGTHTGPHAGTHTGSHNTAGPHNSDALNKADPRVDSDLDGSRNAGAAQYGAGAHNTNTGYGGQHTSTGLTGSSHQTGHATTGSAAGPHSSSMANKVDPRVDSDQDGSRNAGAAQYGAGAHNSNTGYGTEHSSSGLTGNSHQHTGTAAGPHSSSLANKLDPRVDSDQDGSRNAGAAQYGAGAHNSSTGYGTQHSSTGLTGGSHQAGTAAGPHSSSLANKADPRVDSDLDGSRNAGTAQYGTGATNTNTGYGGQNYGDQNYGGQNTSSSGLTGSHQSGGLTGSHGTHAGTHSAGGYSDGPAPGTAGPHKSDFLNKADPRIDSDRDGSKTVGGNPQY